MARTVTALRIVLISAAVLVAVLIALVFLLTRTDFGVEQAGRFAIERLRSSIDGELRVGRVASRGLLRGVTLHDVTIDDAQGRPFLQADSARLAYHFRTIIGGDLSFDRLFVYSPVVHVERLPGQEQWNYERLFPGDTAAPDTTARGVVRIEDATVVDGQIFVRIPWEPELPVEPGDTARLILEEVPGGIVRVFRFDDVDGRLPRILWEDPDEDARIFHIDELATRAYIWETPIEIRRLEGVLTLRDSLLTFEAPRVRLPDSELDMAGQIVISEAGNRYDIEARGEALAFADFQWLYPPLPEDGGGALRFRIQSQGTENILWLARDARLRTGGTEVAGSFGVVTGDTLYFTNVDLEASPLDLELLQSLLPGELPLEGLLIGTVEVEGPISALRTRGDIRYRRAVGGESAVRWTGTIRGRAPYAVRALDAELRRVDLGQVAALAPALKLRGHATGRVRADGSLARGLRLDGELAIERDGTRSVVRGGGEFAVGGDRSRFDLRFDAAPLALDLLAAQYPAVARLTGEATGPVTVTGTLDDLRVDADIVTPAGGIALNGAFVLNGGPPRYRAEGAVTDFRLDRVVDGIPETTLTGRFDVDGEGDRPAVLAGRLDVAIASARVDGIPIHGGRLRLAAAAGMARVDTLALRTQVGDLTASGTFGLAPGASGELRFALHADSLAPLEPLILPPPAAPDTAFFRAARLAGVLTAAGAVQGGLGDFTVEGDATLRGGVLDETRARRVDARVSWTPGARHLALTGSVDSLAAAGRLVRTGRIEGTYAAGVGTITMEAEGPGLHGLAGAGSFARTGDGARFQLHRLAVDTRGGRFELADTAAGRIGHSGFGVQSMVLARAVDGARVELGGVLPWSERGEPSSGTAAFLLDVRDLRIGEVLRLVQTDTILDGVVTGRVSVTGSALAPVAEAALVTRGFRYVEAEMDSLVTELSYRDRVLSGAVGAWRGGSEVLRGEGGLPLDLALTPLADRTLDRSMRLRVDADSLPAALVAFLAPGFRRVEGVLHGGLIVSGTMDAPRFEGELRLGDGAGLFEHSGVHYRRVEATARVRDTQLAIEGAIHTANGRGDVRGTIDLARPTDPRFDLRLIARQIDAARRRDVTAIADGTAYLRGRLSAPIVSGNVRFTQGELNLGEVLRQHRIVQLEPWFYEVLDTTSLDFEPMEEPRFIANLRVADATITLDRGFWLRGPELNTEVTGELAVEYDRRAEDLRLSGTLEAVRGTYELRVLQNADVRLLRDLPGRRFEIRSGTIEFVGTPGIDPNLSIAATHRVRRAPGEPIDVVAEVTGSLQRPRVRLTSESDLPISESDLASYIIFGRSLAELNQAESDVVASAARAGPGEALMVSALVVPTVTGLFSSTLQSVLGPALGVDYVAFTLAPDDWRFADRSTYGSFLEDAQLEVGGYAYRDIFLVGTARIPRGGTGDLGLPEFGVRAEWRFRPTWTSEFYVEDRFARTPSFGLGEIEDRRVVGLSLVRDWGY